MYSVQTVRYFRWWCWVLVILGRNCVAASGSSRSCDRTYARDVQCGAPVLWPSGLPKHRSEAVQGEFPWHVAIYQIENRVPLYSCGGSLISDRFVLTVAHCVVNPSNGFTVSSENFVLQLGHHELGQTIDGCTQERRVRTVIVHPQFRVGAYRHDLAVVELERPAVFNDRVLPVCLDTDEDEPASFYRSIGKVPGWGYTEFDQVSSWLRMTEVPIVNYTHCLGSNPEVFATTLHDGMFCAGYANGTNVCNGDSGGGFVTYRAGRWELQGLVSFTALRDAERAAVCDSRQYAGFVKLRFYRGWISSVCNASWVWMRSEKLTAPDRDVTPVAAFESRLGDCGQRRINKTPLIVNGVRTMAGEWPWHAAIFKVSKRSREYLCGGTLLSESYILTTASCVAGWPYRKYPYVVQLGQNQLWESALTGREVRVLDVETSADSAMALVKLEVDVKYDDYIQPICLPTATPDQPEIGTNGLITGYGQTDPGGSLSPYLKATTMPIVDSGFCVVYRIFDRNDANRMFCAGHGNGTNACLGDQGGGFYQEIQPGTWAVTGVIERINLYRKLCDPHGYVGMANVLPYLEWLTERIRSALLGMEPRTPYAPAGRTKGCRRKHHHQHHRHRHQQHSGSSEDGSDERSISSAVKNVMQAKVDLVKDIHGAASSSVKKLFG